MCTQVYTTYTRNMGSMSWITSYSNLHNRSGSKSTLLGHMYIYLRMVDGKFNKIKNLAIQPRDLMYSKWTPKTRYCWLYTHWLRVIIKIPKLHSSMILFIYYTTVGSGFNSNFGSCGKIKISVSWEWQMLIVS